MESDAEAETVREVYERAIANVPPIPEKRHWKRYIYLWVNYALYEELEAKVKKELGVGCYWSLTPCLKLTAVGVTDMGSA